MNITPLVEMPNSGSLSAASVDTVQPQILAGASGELPDTDRVAFSDLFELAVEQVNHRQEVADKARHAVEIGASDDVAGAMILSQKSSLSFQTMMQVRNRVVSAYETVFNMPV
ncbi:flagellar hook-basal body complex protein FliE [Endozoicomonas ascidiicola]|uniref:flagellar hook-basal body complex protein FliE n=1 Tax=Endozoicomonas ascidiicola TaxID=1698521 RepID=UPI000835604C|nr:flagellar hook-basal body complex protein FliE [Endozoicomonas ascidiicola]